MPLITSLIVEYLQYLLNSTYNTYNVFFIKS